MSKPSGKVSDLIACQKACRAEAGCQSITYYEDAWCSLFSTACTRRIHGNNANKSMRWGGTTADTATTQHYHQRHDYHHHGHHYHHYHHTHTHTHTHTHMPDQPQLLQHLNLCTPPNDGGGGDYDDDDGGDGWEVVWWWDGDGAWVRGGEGCSG